MAIRFDSPPSGPAFGPTVPAEPGGRGAPDTPRELRIRFVGSGSEYFRIWIVNLLLTVVTVGLYYPFAKVRRLRYFHGATELDGQPLAFHADPWKMLRGYLLVGAMLALYSVAGQFSPTAGLVAFAIVALVWPALWHSSLRFRLANTSWRGLRLRYTGTVQQAYRAMALPLLASGLVLAVALFAPDGEPRTPGAPPTAADWALIATPLLVMLLGTPLVLWLLKRQQHDHYAFGSEHTRFEPGLGRFVRFWLAAVGFTLLVVLVFVAATLGVFFVLGQSGRNPMGAPLLLAVTLLVDYVLVFSIVSGYFIARLQNLVWNGTRSEHLRFDSRLRARELISVWFTNTLFVIVTLGLYIPFARVASARLRLQSVRVQASTDLDALVAAAPERDESAAGDAAGDLFGFDLGL